MTLVFSVIGMTYLTSYVLLHLSAAPAYVAIPIWIVASCTLLTWQVVGTLRAANENLVPPSDVFAAWGGYATILIALVLVSLKAVDGVSQHIPMPPPHALMSSATYDVSIDRKTDTISVNGELNYGAEAALSDALDLHPQVKRVILSSSGGQIFAARTIARRILNLGLDTHVDHNCFSACTIVFIAGNKRTLSRDAQLGFHRYAFASRFTVPTINPAQEQDKDRQFFLSRRVSQTFVDRIYDAGHDSLWRPSHATLLAAGVTTASP